MAYSMQNTTHVKLNGEAASSVNINNEWKIADDKYIEDFKPEIPTPSNDDIDPATEIEDRIEEDDITDSDLVNNTTDDNTPAPPTPDHNDNNADGCIGDWYATNSWGQGERSIGPVESHAACVAKAKVECEGFDLANTRINEGTGCWCQKSNGDDITTGTRHGCYQTCRIVALPGSDTTPADDTTTDDTTPVTPDTEPIPEPEPEPVP